MNHENRISKLEQRLNPRPGVFIVDTEEEAEQIKKKYAGQKLTIIIDDIPRP
jgi:hypothetical protein